MNLNIVPMQYDGQPVAFSDDGWLHATKIAERFGKRLDHWMENAETLEYIRALDELMTGGESAILDTRKSGYVKTSRARADRGGGTWLHPKLAVMFARWLDARFAVWCDMQIDTLLRGEHAASRSAMQALGEAIALMEADKQVASASGLALARWKKIRREHLQAVEDARQRAQLVLGFAP